LFFAEAGAKVPEKVIEKRDVCLENAHILCSGCEIFYEITSAFNSRSKGTNQEENSVAKH